MWSSQYRSFIANAVVAIRAYEANSINHGMWSAEDLETIRSAGLKPVTINLISQRIDALSGKEAATRTRFRYKSRSGKPEEVEMAGDVSLLGLFIQEKNRTSRLLSQCRHQARITGLAWHSYEVEDGIIKELTENPLEVVWDARDHTPLMTNQGFVARVKWMTVDEAKVRFPEKHDEIDAASIGGAGRGSPFGFLGETLFDGESSYKLYAMEGYWNEKDREVAVIEFQYREPTKYYTYATEDGLYQTFDKKEAEENAIDKGNIEEATGYKVRIQYFIGSVDLGNIEAPCQMNPAKGLFTLTPTVNMRSMFDGVPYGVVCKALDASRLYNLKQAKINWLMAARQVIMEEGAAKLSDVLKEINKPNGIIVKKRGSELRIDAHAQEIAQHYQALAVHAADIEKAMGIYDEALGMETNAQSGVAIQKRQNASAATTMYTADGFTEAQRQIAEKLLCLIQSVMTNRIALDVTDDEGTTKRLNFNTTVGEGKKAKRVRDIRLGTYDVVIEQMPDSDTMNEVAQQRLMEMMNSGLTPDKWTTGLMDLFNVPKNTTIRKEIEEGLQQKMAQLEELQKQQKIGDAGAAPMGGGADPAVQPNNGMSM